MTDWNHVAETLRTRFNTEDREIEDRVLAADLCKRMARGELVERAPVVKLSDQEKGLCGEPEKEERDHCGRIAQELEYELITMRSAGLTHVAARKIVLRERAAAYKAGFEAGRKAVEG